MTTTMTRVKPPAGYRVLPATNDELLAGLAAGHVYAARGTRWGETRRGRMVAHLLMLQDYQPASRAHTWTLIQMRRMGQ